MDGRRSLNEIPENLKIYIISKLNVLVAGKTSVLSKEWRWLWLSVPRMAFEHNPDGRLAYIPDFLEFVNLRLEERWTARNIYPRPSIVEIQFFGPYTVAVLTRFESFMKLINDLRVKDLTLRSGRINILHKSLLQITYLRELTLSIKCIYLEDNFNWCSLTKLEFNNTIFSGCSQKVFQGSPCLESLKLSGCSAVNYPFEIESKSIKNLTVHDWDTSNMDSRIEVKNAPKLESLTISGWSTVMKISCKIPRIRSVECVFRSLNTCAREPPGGGRESVVRVLHPEFQEHFRTFMMGISNVTQLTLGPHMIEAFTLFWDQNQFNFPNLQTLKLVSHFDKPEVGGIITILRCCPNVEYLKLKPSVARKHKVDTKRRIVAEAFWDNKESIDLAVLPPHLHIDISEDYTGLENEVEFLKKFIDDSLDMAKVE